MLDDSLSQLMLALRMLPGVGPKTSQRMALHLLLERNKSNALQLAKSLSEALERIGHCVLCRMLTEGSVCGFCSSDRRRAEQICVVESHSDVLALEQTDYQGRYFVLQGYLSPLDGITPQDIGIDLLLSRTEKEMFEEIILATNLTVEGEATAHYIKERLPKGKLKISRIAHGVPMGGELEYMDGPTLGLALVDRRDYSY